MRFVKSGATFALAIGAAACGQGNSGNVMAPSANALTPAEVNAALGPEVTATPDANTTGNDLAETNAANNVADKGGVPDEPVVNGAAD